MEPPIHGLNRLSVVVLADMSFKRILYKKNNRVDFKTLYLARKHIDCLKCYQAYAEYVDSATMVHVLGHSALNLEFSTN